MRSARPRRKRLVSSHARSAPRSANTSSPDWAPQLGARLREAGYTAEQLGERLHIHYPDDVGLLNHAAAVERLGNDGAAATTLMRLFFLEIEVPYRQLAGVLSRRVCDDLVAAGLLRCRRGMVGARLRLDPIGAQYFLADLRFRAFDRKALHLGGSDPVYAPGSDSVMLRDLVDAPHTGRVLDLCTGSGVQAMQRARGAEQVVAVDVNPRAAALARFNGRLNGVDNLDVRAGDLYAPVRGERFDLIIANPPFVSSPYAAAPAYHSGGPRGDRVLRRITAALDRYLQPGGRAFAVTHAALRSGEAPQEVAGRWFRRFQGRALVLVLETGTPVDLAAAQSLFALRQGLAAYAAEVKRWVRYLHRQHIASIALLLLVAERSGRPGVEVIEAHSRVLPIPLEPPPRDRIATWLQADKLRRPSK